MQMLRPEEVEMLVCGNPELDMEALRKVTVYDGYTKNDPTVRLVGVLFSVSGIYSRDENGLAMIFRHTDSTLPW